ncbi:MAG: RIP metalloprotease RseP [Candidatus Moranbacteria bacterium RIFOXYB1_FULL_43_19]|nr:MAG: RIP metalloprotease RseP [Candidatus Moranbacteria bacterium RIFOXYB1_FULL_43_19]OGI28950.1 MAG: RIP metalloprotease RseP [Candidatus Moranbacteria bacterium RIFOXYA1_FULL_44_7]OGI33647.1 MAG: RIP metalloprotease RseP [Candidatus Moranbacteria bacterium RIFOXYC1_FULL_44_13]OGI37190.1 MAG: RIP metalloprotease RseP [Candidatus Moranbacteria bacterium RIFOXYD1_FULL_44_12]
MITVLIFIFILGLLVFVHELGHFLVARRNGVEVEEFGFGFPPRIFGVYWNWEGKRRIIWGSKEIEEVREARKIGEEKTVYSFNWIPLGGFVKITGEDGEKKGNPKSFASKPPFTRVRILAAGVVMNFLLAAALFSFGFWLGVPQPAEEVKNGKVGNEKIQIVDVGKGTPAEAMGIRAGDEILGAMKENNLVKFSSVEEVQNFIGENKGSQVILEIQRGKEKLEIFGTPRADFPEGEGPLGIGLAKIVVAKYPWYRAIAKGFQYTFDLTITFISFLGLLIWRLIVGQPAGLDVSGPVGIAVLTGQVAQLGFDYLIRFTAMLSVNLAIINILPIPALDGGRILFILIERLKGSPISQKFEQRAHSLGFALLISLMVFVTVRDFMKFDLVEKAINLF